MSENKIKIIPIDELNLDDIVVSKIIEKPNGMYKCQFQYRDHCDPETNISPFYVRTAKLNITAANITSDTNGTCTKIIIDFDENTRNKIYEFDKIINQMHIKIQDSIKKKIYTDIKYIKPKFDSNSNLDSKTDSDSNLDSKTDSDSDSDSNLDSKTDSDSDSDSDSNLDFKTDDDYWDYVTDMISCQTTHS